MTSLRTPELAEIADLNPELGESLRDDDCVSFIPMSAVDADTATTDDSATRRYAEVSKGYKSFLDGDVLIAKITPCFENGKIAQARLSRRVGFGSTEFHVVRPHPNQADPRYVLHFLRQERVRVEGERRMTGSAGQRRVPEDFIARLRVPLPPLPEQRWIAKLLDLAEALRAKRRAALAQLDTLTQAIFLDMFGDPVTNPKGWSEAKLGDVVAEMQYGPRFYNEAYADDGIRIVRITDLTASGELDFESMPRMRVPDDETSQFQLRPGDVIFARSGATVGKVALFGAADPPCIPGAYFIRMRFTDVVKSEYATAVLTSTSIRTIVESQSRQAAQQNFSGPGLKRLPMPTPPVSLQRQFVERKLAIDHQRRAERAALSHLDSLVASLQHRAFRGELGT